MNRLTAIAAACLLLAGCGSSTDEPAASPPPVTSFGATEVASSPATMDAADLAGALAKRIPAAKITKVYTEADDPNHLLGRPGGYTGKVAFSDSRVKAADRDADPMSTTNGGGIETFTTPAEATARRDYIQASLKANPMLGTEYDYVAGSALLRVSGVLTPTAAREYEAAWPEIAGR
jgi:hypothetical protein